MIFQIHPYAKMAWSVLSVIPKVCPLSDLKEIHILHLYVYQTIIDQVNHHKNVRTLLQDIHNIFNVGKLVDSLGAINSGSTQAQIFTAILRQVVREEHIILYVSAISFSTLQRTLIFFGSRQAR
jgi:hypothetical protein